MASIDTGMCHQKHAQCCHYELPCISALLKERLCYGFRELIRRGASHQLWKKLYTEWPAKAIQAVRQGDVYPDMDTYKEFQ